MFVIHSTCGQRTSSADTCTACGERLTAENTSWHSLTRTPEPVRLATAGSPSAPRNAALHNNSPQTAAQIGPAA